MLLFESLFVLEIKSKLEEELKPVKIEKKEMVQRLEEENLSIEKQERNKEEKLKRTETQMRKALKKLRSKDISIYNVLLLRCYSDYFLTKNILF